LTFVLLGVATPTDLIKDRDRTPFNIGHAIDLLELSRADAQPLEDGLERSYPGRGKAILDRVFYWTGGHPYLTQKLCQRIAEAEDGAWIDERIDALVTTMFLAPDAARKEENLHFVRSRIEANPARRPLLQLYRRIYKGTVVAVDDRSLVQNHLRLTGLVRPAQARLVVHNEIYRRVFDLAWIGETMPVDRNRLMLIGAVVLGALTILLIILVLQLPR
jgi:hypothetical protein